MLNGLHRIARLMLAWVIVATMVGCGADVSTPVPSGGQPEPLSTGPQTVWSGGVPREYFLRLPTDYDTDGLVDTASESSDDKPLIIAFHGYTGSYENWVGESPVYNLLDAVGDDAIFVAPNGLPDAAGNRIWGGTADLNFFVDLLADLDRRGLRYNPNRIFVAGHSNGAGFVHNLGCLYGDVIRAVVAAAGGLTRNDCIGSVAVLLFQGSNDPLTVPTIGRNALHYWVLYNGWDENAFVPAAVGPCDNYAFPEQPDNLAYPVLWCEHTEGHDWPTFAGTTAWAFLSDLPDAAPGPAAPPGGGAAVATPPSDALLTFQIAAPAGMNRPLAGAASLRQLDYIDNPTCSVPDVFLNTRFSVDGRVVPGQVSEPITIPVTYFSFSGGVSFPSDWALAITIYVEGGGSGTIPSPGIDHDVIVPVSLIAQNSDVIISDTLTIEPAADICNF